MRRLVKWSFLVANPCLLKIIMYEGTQKYAMRGETKQYNGKSDNGVQLYYGGEYKQDKAFSEGPKDFLKFAKKLWEDNCLERWGEEEQVSNHRRLQYL